MRCVSFILVLVLCFASCKQNTERTEKRIVEEVSLGENSALPYPEYLSEWELFKQPMNKLQPVEKALPYQLNTPLFSDYAQKSRFIKMPDDKQMRFHATNTFSFPDSTILVKSFYYPKDFKTPDLDRVLIETRLLLKEGDEWKALTYVWNKEQTEARLTVSGDQIPVSWKDQNGELQSLAYSVPNLVQCKSCHEKNGKMVPIGPKARNLSNTYKFESGSLNQLVMWKEAGLIDGMEDVKNVKPMPVWEDTESGTLNEKARAWLDVNCAHCHSTEGPAKNSGLYLSYLEDKPYRLGVKKAPVAAGRGSAGMLYSIVPGEPEQSILYQRISSLDPGVMMPELGRKMVHKEGVKVVESWIKSLK